MPLSVASWWQKPLSQPRCGNSAQVERINQRYAGGAAGAGIRTKCVLVVQGQGMHFGTKVYLALDRGLSALLTGRRSMGSMGMALG